MPTKLIGENSPISRRGQVDKGYMAEEERK
jgi:hypothetical protein